MLAVSALYSGMRAQTLPGIDLQLSTSIPLADLGQAVLVFSVSLRLTENALRGGMPAGEAEAGVMGTNCEFSYANT